MMGQVNCKKKMWCLSSVCTRQDQYIFLAVLAPSQLCDVVSLVSVVAQEQRQPQPRFEANRPAKR